MPDRRREARDIYVGIRERVFKKRGLADDDRRLRTKRLAFFHPGLECVERPQRRIESERQGGALHIRRRVGEDAKAALMAFDVVEQKRRAVRQAGGDLGDAADLEPRVGAVDAAQRAELVDEADKFPQVFVHATCLRPVKGLMIKSRSSLYPGTKYK